MSSERLNLNGSANNDYDRLVKDVSIAKSFAEKERLCNEYIQKYSVDKTNASILALAYNKLGALLYGGDQEATDLDGQYVLCERAMDAFSSALELDPSNGLYKENLSASCNKFGIKLFNKASGEATDFNDKIELYNRAIELYFRAFNLDSSDVLYTTNLHTAYDTVVIMASNAISLAKGQKFVLVQKVMKLFFEGYELAPDNLQIREILFSGMLKFCTTNSLIAPPTIAGFYQDNIERLRVDEKFADLVKYLKDDCVKLMRSLYYPERVINYYNNPSLGQGELLSQLEKDGFIERGHKPLSLEANSKTNHQINVNDFSSTLTPLMQDTLSKLYDLFHNKAAECLVFLKPLNEYIRDHANDGQDFANVPEGEVIRIGAHLYTLPPEGYEVIRNKGRLLQKGLDDVLHNHGLDVESKKVIFCGFVDKQKANGYVKGNSLFTENIAFGHALVHGKFKHLLDIYIIAEWLKRQKKIDLHTPSLKEVLDAMVSSVSAQNRSLWSEIIDNSSSELLQNKINSNFYMGSTKDATSMSLFNNLYGEYLAGYMRNQFWRDLEELQKYQSISPEMILAANAATQNAFNGIKDVSSSPKEYYEGRGYVLAESGDHYLKPSKPGVKLFIDGNVGTKIYEEDQLYLAQRALSVTAKIYKEHQLHLANEALGILQKDKKDRSADAMDKVYQVFNQLQEDNPEFLRIWARTLTIEKILYGVESFLIVKYVDILKTVLDVHKDGIQNEFAQLCHITSSIGSVESVRYLCELGGNIKPEGMIDDALCYDRYDIAEFLLVSGFDRKMHLAYHLDWGRKNNKEMISILKKIIRHPNFDIQCLQAPEFLLEEWATTIDIGLLELLLPKCDFKLDNALKMKKSSLEQAINGMEPERLKLFLENDPSIASTIIVRNDMLNTSETLLHIADSVDVCKILVENGADVNALTNARASFGENRLLTPFAQACRTKNLTKAKWIASTDQFDPRIKSHLGDALYYAVEARSVELINSLCDRYPDLISDYGEMGSLLHNAAIMYERYNNTQNKVEADKYLEIIKALLSHGMSTSNKLAQNILNTIAKDGDSTQTDVAIDADVAVESAATVTEEASSLLGEWCAII